MIIRDQQRDSLAIDDSQRSQATRQPLDSANQLIPSETPFSVNQSNLMATQLRRAPQPMTKSKVHNHT
jgi:hypothetical protein